MALLDKRPSARCFPPRLKACLSASPVQAYSWICTVCILRIREIHGRPRGSDRINVETKLSEEYRVARVKQGNAAEKLIIRVRVPARLRCSSNFAISTKRTVTFNDRPTKERSGNFCFLPAGCLTFSLRNTRLVDARIFIFSTPPRRREIVG